ncbi:MAG: hypothetical protein K0R17_1470 [Rariglobus sp.]|jgi:autotransporter-associated beta strand protein|nr:hypothetical protein [Rariglobus sp.]
MKNLCFAQSSTFPRGQIFGSPGQKPVLGSAFRILPVTVLILAGGVTAKAASVNWDGGGVNGTDWNTATNWSGDVLPGASDTVFFTTTGLPASTVISLGASQTIRELRINSYSNVPTFTIGSAADITAGNTLTLTNVYRGDNNSGTQTIAANVNLAGDSVWNIINGYSGTVSVTGAVGSASDVTLVKEGSNSLTLSGANTFTGGVRSVGGSLILTNTNAYTGTTAATGGNVTLSFGAATATNIVNSSSTLALGGIRGGGTLTVNGRNLANVVNSQTFNGLTLNAGASTLSIVNGISSGKTLVSLGAITRNVGGTVNFVQPTVATTISAQNGYTTTSTNDAGNILGGWATVGSANWATNDGTNIVAYTAYTNDAWAAGNNTTVTTSGTIADDSTTHSLRFNAAAANTLTLGGTNTITSGGILVTSAVGNNLTTLTGGTLRGSSGGDLVIHQHNTSNSLTIASNIADNTTPTALTKSGSGNLNLTGTLGHTGGTYVNAGTLTLVAGSTDPLVNTGAITVAGGTLSLGTGTNQSTSGAVVLASGTLSGGTLTKSGANYDVRNGTISTKLAGSVGLDKTTSGTVTLSNTAANTFTGTTTITEGNVIGGGAANVIAISGDLVVGSVSGINAASYTNSGSNTVFNSAKNITVYSNGTVSLGGGAQSLNGTISIFGGTITGSQVYQNVTVNMTGGTWSGTTYGNNNSFNTSASDTTATISAALQSSQATKTFTVADGAASVDALMSGSIATGAVTKAGAGYLSMTGSKAYTGITTISGGTLAASVLANGNTSSSIGASSNAAASLRLGNGTTFQYTGSGHTTDRLFTVNGTAAGDSATVEASGTGAVNFNNTGSTAWGTTNQTRTLKLGGTSTADNTLSALIANNGTGAVAFTKEGVGKWILTNANTYTGATTVNGGSLIVNGSLASGSAVTVNSGGTLGGSGIIGGSVTVESGGFLAPGNSPGILTVGSLNLATGSTTSLEIAGAAVRGTDFDGITVTNLNGLTYGGTLSFSFTSSLTNGDTLDLFSFTGTTGGAFTSVVSTGAYAGTWTVGTGVWTLISNDQLLTFNNATGDLLVVANAIPEPSTYAVIGGLLALAAAVCRRSRSSRV